MDHTVTFPGFSIFVSAIFLCLLVWVAWVASPSSEDGAVQSGSDGLRAVYVGIFGMAALSLLVFVSRVGDTWNATRNRVLSPGCVVNLVDRMSAPKTAGFVASMERTDLGFALLGITATSYKVLYLLGSGLGAMTYLAPYF